MGATTGVQLQRDRVAGARIAVDLDRGGSGGGGWSVSPVWIAIGVIGGLLLIVLVVMAARGRDWTA